jgi:hypothetical protein
MGRFILVVLIAAAAFAWYKGWIQEWVGEAADSGIAGVKQTRSNATKTREADPGAPAEKK